MIYSLKIAGCFVFPTFKAANLHSADSFPLEWKKSTNAPPLKVWFASVLSVDEKRRIASRDITHERRIQSLT